MKCSMYYFFRYIKILGNVIVDYLFKYLVVRLVLEEFRSKGELN